MDQPRVQLNGAPSARDLEMGYDGVDQPPPVQQQDDQPAAIQRVGQAANSWVGNDSNTLLVVAVLTTTLTYQLGTSIPGGYWQQDVPRLPKDSTVMYHAGDPIMRDLHHPRYWVFMAASWVGFVSSMVMTLSLLVRMAVDSRHVRWSFAVAYSSLVLIFVVSQCKTHLTIDIFIWIVVVAFLWVIVSLRPERRERAIQALCCGGRAN